jgi:hypothetical protein
MTVQHSREVCVWWHVNVAFSFVFMKTSMTFTVHNNVFSFQAPSLSESEFFKHARSGEEGNQDELVCGGGGLVADRDEGHLRVLRQVESQSETIKDGDGTRKTGIEEISEVRRTDYTFTRAVFYNLFSSLFSTSSPSLFILPVHLHGAFPPSLH